MADSNNNSDSVGKSVDNGQTILESPKSLKKITPKEEENQNAPSEFSLSLFIVKFIVILYTVITYPFFYILQRPWEQVEKFNKVRSKLENPNDPYSPYVRVDEAPVQHYAFKSNTIYELQQNVLTMNPPDLKTLGRREILNVVTHTLANGKRFNKYELSDYKWVTMSQTEQIIENLARGFLKNGVKYQGHTLIFAETRMEWFLAAQALFRIGSAVTTLYATLGSAGVVHGINETEVEHIITTEDLLPSLLKIIDKTPKVKKIYYVEMNKGLLRGAPLKQEDFEKARPDSQIELITYNQLLETGSKVKSDEFQVTRPKPEDVAVILYTSGSTGNPKGVVLTHQNFVASVRAVCALFKDSIIDDYQNHIYYGLLPLAHSLEMTAELVFFSIGLKIGYGSPFTMTDNGTAIIKGQKGDLRMLKPTILAGVPLILDRIRKTISDKFERRNVFWKQLFKFSSAYKNYWIDKGFDTPLVNHFICKPIKSQLGGQVQYMLIGGAPLSPDTQRLMRAFLNIKLLIGYGSTETCAASCVTDIDDNSIGQIGAPLVGVKVRLVDWPEGGYSVHDKPNPRGELVVGGKTISNGYFKLPDQTADNYEMIDGENWFKMGDIGEVFPNGSFKIIDRKKDLVKLQFGEYVSLGKVEAELKNCPFVDNICVYGDSMHTFMIAFISPNMGDLKRLAKELNKEDKTKEELCNDPEIIKKVTETVLQFGREYDLNKMEIPQKIKLCADEWSSNTGLLTASLKINRRNVQKAYQEDIVRMYSSK